ncbi:efflux RND transporter periplasmic adaptor subunit [Sediminimonas sp.]|uniref:efflux RND transporter periplasmic adaptor subunit n=1 Tax=Sediminimonas sp. TaxID=2823379 RepID=UPI0025E9A6D1|nr:efflux RND transporter periplasmic adaptor subunit [Sediminimonas sp.]
MTAFISALRQLALIALLLAVAVWGWLNYIPGAAEWMQRTGLPAMLGFEVTAAQAPGDGEGRQREARETPVVLAPVETGVLNDRVTAIGDALARRAVTVRAQATGRIERIAFDAGARVSKGAMIFKLEDEAERIALDQAHIAIDKAQDDLERLTRLESSGTVSELRTAEARRELRSARLQVRQAEFELSQRVVRAPIGGRIGFYEVEVGDRITAQDALTRITDRSGLLVDFRVPERIVGKLRTGMTVRLRPLAQPDRALTGHISTIDTEVDRASRTLRLRAALDNDDDTLRPGMAFEVTLSLPGERLAAVDPLAVQWSDAGAFVWAARDGKAVRVPVAIRQRDSDRVLVEGELREGEQVVIEGVQMLRPGAPLDAANEEGDGAAAAASAPRQRG